MASEKIVSAIMLLERRRGKVLTPETRVEWARRLSQFREDVAIESIRHHADGGAEWIDCRAIVMTAERIQRAWESSADVRYCRMVDSFNKTQIKIGAETVARPALPGVRHGIQIGFIDPSAG